MAPTPTLATAQIGPGTKLLEALKATGYLPASAHVITVTGPGSASAVMKVIEQRYCQQLSSQQFTEIGVRRDANTWLIVLARPLLQENLGDWQVTGREILRLTNAARAEPRNCGSRRFGTAPALRWNDKLGAAAHVHSRDMAARNYFDHIGRDGSEPAARATRTGYVWQRIGENIAAGQGSPEQAMSAWLSSPVHCANIMEPAFTEMGSAYVVNPNSNAVIYWTQELGTAR